MLEVEDLTVGHGMRTVLRDVHLDVSAGDVLCVLGPNGAGKSTLLRTIAGLLPPLRGTIRLAEQNLKGRAPHQRAAAGLAFVPEGQQSFPALSVEENLQVVRRRSAQPRTGDDTDRIYDLFPKLRQRSNQAAGTLSGGERQMLALGRALMLDPVVLLLDEPSHGLAPIIVGELAEIIAQVAQATPVLLVEQNLSIPRRCATSVIVLDHGSASAPHSPDILDSDALHAAYLGA